MAPLGTGLTGHSFHAGTNEEFLEMLQTDSRLVGNNGQQPLLIMQQPD